MGKIQKNTKLQSQQNREKYSSSNNKLLKSFFLKNFYHSSLCSTLFFFLKCFVVNDLNSCLKLDILLKLTCFLLIIKAIKPKTKVTINSHSHTLNLLIPPVKFFTSSL